MKTAYKITIAFAFLGVIGFSQWRFHGAIVPKEDVWAVVYGVLKEEGLVFESWDEQRQEAKSSFYKIRNTSLWSPYKKVRQRYSFKYEEGEIRTGITDRQYLSYGSWMSFESMKSMIGKNTSGKTKKLSNRIKSFALDKDRVEEAKRSFFLDVNVLSCVAYGKSELFLKKWFDEHLKNREVTWNLMFKNVEEHNDNPFKDYKYKESYILNGDVMEAYKGATLSEIIKEQQSPTGNSYKENRMVIYKYTNDPESSYFSVDREYAVKGFPQNFKIPTEKESVHGVILTENSSDDH